jgi:hypothetical protein
LYFADTPGYHAVDLGEDRYVSNVVRLRVTDTIVAVSAVSFVTASSEFVTIPVGAVIEATENMNTLGLHPVTYDGRELFVFTRDIREGTVRVSSAKA